jgi:hypothetical protein
LDKRTDTQKADQAPKNTLSNIKAPKKGEKA